MLNYIEKSHLALMLNYPVSDPVHERSIIKGRDGGKEGRKGILLGVPVTDRVIRELTITIR